MLLEHAKGAHSMRKVLPLFFALLASVHGGPGDKVVGGPYVVNVGSRTATVVWVVETARPSLGTEPGKSDKTAPALSVEKVSFKGLDAGKTYYYDTNGSEEGKGSFKTPP